MKKMLLSLAMVVFMWTVVEKYCLFDTSGGQTIWQYIIENESQERKAIRMLGTEGGVYRVGDKVTITKRNNLGMLYEAIELEKR